MTTSFRGARCALVFLFLWALLSGPVRAEDSADVASGRRHPLLDAPKDRSGGEKALHAVPAIIEFPFALLGHGLEQTLHFVEREDLAGAVERVPRWLAKRHLIVTGGGQGNGSGIGVGAGVFAPVGPGTLTLLGKWTVRHYQFYEASLGMPLGAATRVRGWGRYRLRAQDNFYGLGQDNDEDGRTQYEQADVDVGVTLARRLASSELAFVGDWTDYDEIEAHRNEDEDDPSTVNVFPGLSGADGATLFSVGARFRHPAVLYRGGRAPENGVELAVRVHRDADDDRFGFTRYSLMLYRAVPIFWGDRVLAARIWGSVVDPHADRDVPFWLLSDLGGANGLRAYDPLRFRDRDAALLNLEYRFPIWNIGVPSGLGMDAVLFFDSGLVSHALEDDLILDELRSDFGFGFRIRTNELAVARMNVAFGDDDYRIEFKTGRDF